MLEVLARQVDHVQQALDSHPDVPLVVHARYSRIEILGRPASERTRASTPPWQTGIYWAKDATR